MNQYEKLIVQKYIIAIAFAVIKSKPLGQPLEEYVNEVRNNLSRREDFFQDVSISDSDFAIRDDEINDVSNAIERKETQSIVPETNVSDKMLDELVSNFERDHLTQSNDVNGKCKPVGDATRIVSVLKDINSTEESTGQQSTISSSIKDVLDIFKDIDKTNKNKIFINTSTPNNAQSQSTPGSNSQRYITKDLTVDNEITFCSFGEKDETNKIDIQDTELYTVHGYTDNFTHISQSQDVNIVVPNKLIQNCNSTNNNDGSNVNKKLKNISYRERNSDIHTNKNNISITKDTLHNCNTVEECVSNVSDLDTDTRVYDDKNKKIKTSNNSVTRSSDDYSNLFADILNDGNSKKYNASPNACENLKRVSNKSTFSSTSLLNELELDSSSLIGSSKPREHSLDHQEHQNKIQVECDVRDVNVENNIKLSDHHFIFSSTDSETQYYARNDNAKEDLNPKAGLTLDKNTCKCGQLSSGYETQCASRNLLLDSRNEIEEKSDTEATEEIVTFKVLEELNRVKNYLNRHDRINDSGRSSQGSQLSGARINESGYCLLNYLLENPLIERTLDIAEEVSRVLGEFVDKLHEEENYPLFVQKLLECAQDLINDIYKEDRTEDLLKKEEQIDRLLLLNRSVHVTKFTIEKMQPVLHEVHQLLQRRDLLELRLVGSENLCYVLHTLEVLLRRYNAAASSQASTQQSQDEDKSLKRSTITEIWRKKWNLSKSDVSEGSFKRKCVLTQTSEVLNKIIVEGMDGYSLVSFAALQCFNLLQS